MLLKYTKAKSLKNVYNVYKSVKILYKKDPSKIPKGALPSKDNYC